MDCREFREELRRPNPGESSASALRHESSCAACAREARAARLLRLGSDTGGGESPRPGFEQRLRARLAAEPRTIPGRNGGLEPLVRPALALATTMMLVCGGLYIRLAQPDPGGDLASLVETDPILTPLGASDPESIFAEPDSPTAGDQP